MDNNEIKQCKIVPKFPVPDILYRKHIEDEMVLSLNRAEVTRALEYADVYEILEDGTNVLLDPTNFNITNTDKLVGDKDDPIIPERPDLATHDVTGLDNAGLDQARFY